MTGAVRVRNDDTMPIVEGPCAHSNIVPECTGYTFGSSATFPIAASFGAAGERARRDR